MYECHRPSFRSMRNSAIRVLSGKFALFYMRTVEFAPVPYLHEVISSRSTVFDVRNLLGFKDHSIATPLGIKAFKIVQVIFNFFGIGIRIL